MPNARSQARLAYVEPHGEEPVVNILEVHESARKLYQAHGDKAELEAAQKARSLRESGHVDEAENWQRIREAIAQMRGAGNS